MEVEAVVVVVTVRVRESSRWSAVDGKMLRGVSVGVGGVTAARSLRSFSGPTFPEAYPAKVEARR